MAIGGALGGIVTTALVNRVGRRICMMLISVLFITGWMIIGLAWNIYIIIGGRILTGAMSCASTIVGSIYVAEVVHHRRRGRLGSILSLMIAIGIIYVMISGSLLRWNYSAYLCVIPHIFALVSLIFLPESPHYLLSKGKYEDAKNSLIYFNNAEDATEFFDDIRLHLQEEKEDQCRKRWDGNSVKMIAILSLIMMFGRLSGISIMSYYTVDIMDQSSSTLSPAFAATLAASMEIVGCLIGTFLMDKLGRKSLLIISSLGLSITLSALGYSFYEYTNSWVPLVSVGMFYIFFAVGHALVPVVLMGELFRPTMKSIGSMIAMTSCWIFNFLTGKSFYVLRELFGGLEYVFWMFALFTLVGMIFIAVCLPETKNKTLHQIQKYSKPTTNNNNNLEDEEDEEALQSQNNSECET